MRLCFIDFAPWDYDVATPTIKPLGGSQSALCYLAIALARKGHAVTALTGVAKPGSVRGVECLNVTANCNQWFFQFSEFDAVIVLNAAGNGRKLRDIMPRSTRLILWTQHAANQGAMRNLEQPAIRDAWDGIVCVSDWQARDIVGRFGCDPVRMTVLRNAIAPAFQGLFVSKYHLAVVKSGPPQLVYTSTPYRGLQFLTSIFPAYKADHPDATLDAYSSMAVYMESEEKDRQQFSRIYDALGEIGGVRLAGSLPQPELAKRLAEAHIWAYPNAFPETSCIAAMEAMAAGLQIVTSDLGALPETCAGFAKLVPIDIEIDEDSASITVKGGNDYIAAFTEALFETRSDPAKLYDQVFYMNQHHTWLVRARQWTDYLTRGGEHELPRPAQHMDEASGVCGWPPLAEPHHHAEGRADGG